MNCTLHFAWHFIKVKNKHIHAISLLNMLSYEGFESDRPPAVPGPVAATKLRPTVLEMLHLTHVGMTGIKILAKPYVWWPNLNADIERFVKTCKDCNKYGKSARR